jgi:hypothetical protein
MAAPQGAAFQKSMQIAGTLTGVASAGSGLVLGVRYGDWRSAFGGVSGLLTGTFVARAYGKYAKAMGYSNTDLSQATVRNVASAIGGNFDFGSSGRCGKK